MRTKKSKALQLVLALAVSGASAVSTSAFAQAYPNKPIKLVVGFTPGGAADFTGRATAEASHRRKQARRRL
jgi:tripartite-type tricarboxylate transporter receptor subunit TctC